jgi:hypothetical protein
LFFRCTIGLTGNLDSGLSVEDINKIVEEANEANKILSDMSEFVKIIDKDI